MTLALASGWTKDGPALARAAEAARRLGFVQVFASEVPRDPTRAKAALKPLGVTLAGIACASVDDPNALRAAVDAAGEAAATLARPLVVVDVGNARSDPRRPPQTAVATTVETWARAFHAALAAWPGLSIAVRPTGEKDRLFGIEETEWLLDALSSKPVGLWLDPARAMHAERAPSNDRSGTARGALAWADRFAPRTLGVVVAGLGADGLGRAPPEDDGPDWGTLRGLVPARAARVLDVGPHVSPEEVVDARRRFEEMLGW